MKFINLETSLTQFYRRCGNFEALKKDEAEKGVVVKEFMEEEKLWQPQSSKGN